MRYVRRLVAVAGALIVVACAMPARGAIIAGQVDTFEDPGTHGWSNGANNPTPAQNVTTGGPAGAGDNFLRLASNGSSAAGGRLVMFNSAQWAGDYLAADVDAIQMQVNNLGSTELTLRLILVGAGPSLTTVAPVIVPAGSGWTTVSFSLAPDNVGNSPAYTTVMQNVTELNLLHSPDVIAGRQSAPPVVATLGVDNITAVPVPEPGLLASAAIGFAAVMRRGVRRAAANN